MKIRKSSLWYKLALAIFVAYLVLCGNLYFTWTKCECKENLREETELYDRKVNRDNRTNESMLSYNIATHMTQRVTSASVDSVDDETGATEVGERDTSTSQRENRKLKVLLIGKARYGSTFLGQFLNGHPEIFYIFEPIRTIHFMAKFGAIPPEMIDAGAVEILRSLFKCEFPSYFVHHNIRRWDVGVYNSRAIRMFCGGVNDCSSRELDEFSELCELFEYQAIKVIRLSSLRLLEPLVTKDKHDLKIIFLVRDPRGVAVSRRTMKFPPNQRNASLVELKLVGGPRSDLADLHPENINYDCRWLRENLKFIEQPPDWLKDRVLFLRHEDVAINTGKYVDGIYDFLKIEKHVSIDGLVDKLTHSNVSTTDNNMETRRNSLNVVHSWRKITTLDDVIAIQNVCRDVMQRLGYRLIRTQDELTDIKHFTIF